MTDLKLIAFDAEDLAVFSANLQDAVVRATDMTYLKAEKRFVAVANRFDWEASVATGGKALSRRRCGIRFERVLGAKVTGFQPGDGEAVLSLLSIVFEETAAPGGALTLTFSGGAAIRLDVEYVEGELKDLGAAWQTDHLPQHDDAATPKVQT